MLASPMNASPPYTGLSVMLFLASKAMLLNKEKGIVRGSLWQARKRSFSWMAIPCLMLTHAGTDNIAVFISRNGHRKEQALFLTFHY